MSVAKEYCCSSLILIHYNPLLISFTTFVISSLIPTALFKKSFIFISLFFYDSINAQCINTGRIYLIRLKFVRSISREICDHSVRILNVENFKDWVLRCFILSFYDWISHAKILLLSSCLFSFLSIIILL